MAMHFPLMAPLVPLLSHILHAGTSFLGSQLPFIGNGLLLLVVIAVSLVETFGCTHVSEWSVGCKMDIKWAADP